MLVGLELDGNETAGHGDDVYVGRRKVGVVTSGTRSPVLKKNIALCRMAVQYADLGTQVEVGKLDGLQKRIPATVVRFPFYDPEKTRPSGGRLSLTRCWSCAEASAGPKDGVRLKPDPPRR